MLFPSTLCSTEIVSPFGRMLSAVEMPEFEAVECTMESASECAWLAPDWRERPCAVQRDLADEDPKLPSGISLSAADARALVTASSILFDGGELGAHGLPFAVVPGEHVHPNVLAAALLTVDRALFGIAALNDGDRANHLFSCLIASEALVAAGLASWL